MLKLLMKLEEMPQESYRILRKFIAVGWKFLVNIKFWVG